MILQGKGGAVSADKENVNILLEIISKYELTLPNIIEHMILISNALAEIIRLFSIVSNQLYYLQQGWGKFFLDLFNEVDYASPPHMHTHSVW